MTSYLTSKNRLHLTPSDAIRSRIAADFTASHNHFRRLARCDRVRSRRENPHVLARDLEKKRIAELQHRPPDPGKRASTFGALNVAAAVDQYADDRRSQGSERLVAW